MNQSYKKELEKKVKLQKHALDITQTDSSLGSIYKVRFSFTNCLQEYKKDCGFFSSKFEAGLFKTRSDSNVAY